MVLQKLRRLMEHRNRDERGFTLVELMMVMAIVGVLAAIGFTGFNAIQNRASRTQADVYWRDLNNAVRIYKVENPSTEELNDIGVLVGEYLDNDVWGEDEADFDAEIDGDDKVCVWVSGVASTHNTSNCGEGPTG